ncbi:MAG TPA: GNA1162 family protein, partial [Candidatus Binataceae bacterium]|nr:GNA1162 family protein [Candidatus Binataceae bacterium]
MLINVPRESTLYGIVTDRFGLQKPAARSILLAMRRRRAVEFLASNEISSCAERHIFMGLTHTGYVFLLPLCFLPLIGCAPNQNAVETRPFYQKELATDTHGKKTLFDRIVETDPGGLNVTMADDYEEHAPATIAVLPFTDKGSAQYVVNKIPLSFRNKKERDEWAWTDAQRLRRAFVAYFSEREFNVVNPIAVDAVLQTNGINNDEELKQVSVLKLGKWLHCDAVMYGTVESYDAYYFGLVSGYVVGVNSRMVSTHDGETLMRSEGSRWSMNVMPALDMEDILINSAENLLQLRDVELARAEEEVARELVIRIPPSE